MKNVQILIKSTVCK